MDFYTLDVAYSVYPILARKRWMTDATPVNPYESASTSYDVKGKVILDDVGEYPYSHRHNKIRPASMYSVDCPQGQTPINESCLNKCLYDSECAQGYSCKKGVCQVQLCNNDADCSSGHCNINANNVRTAYKCVPRECSGDNQRCILTSDGLLQARSPNDDAIILTPEYEMLYGIR